MGIFTYIPIQAKGAIILYTFTLLYLNYLVLLNEQYLCVYILHINVLRSRKFGIWRFLWAKNRSSQISYAFYEQSSVNQVLIVKKVSRYFYYGVNA